MDRVTQDIVKAVLEGQKMGAMLGDLVSVPNTSIQIRLSKRLGEAELRRLRHQYLKLAGVRAQTGIATIANTFADYLKIGRAHV